MKGFLSGASEVKEFRDTCSVYKDYRDYYPVSFETKLVKADLKYLKHHYNEELNDYFSVWQIMPSPSSVLLSSSFSLFSDPNRELLWIPTPKN